MPRAKKESTVETSKVESTEEIPESGKSTARQVSPETKEKIAQAIAHRREMLKAAGEGAAEGASDSADVVETPLEAQPEYVDLEIDTIADSPWQPRREPSPKEDEEMIKSIQEHNILVPVLVRMLLTGPELIGGHRRKELAKRAGLTHIPARVKYGIDDRTAAKWAIIDNIQRVQISRLDEALAYKRLRDEFGDSAEKIATECSRSMSSVYDALRVAELPEEVLNLVRNGKLSYSHTVALAGIADNKAKLIELTDVSVNLNWSAKKLESEIITWKEDQEQKKAAAEAEARPPLPLENSDTSESKDAAKSDTSESEGEGESTVEITPDMQKVLDILTTEPKKFSKVADESGLGTAKFTIVHPTMIDAGLIEELKADGQYLGYVRGPKAPPLAAAESAGASDVSEDAKEETKPAEANSGANSTSSKTSTTTTATTSSTSAKSSTPAATTPAAAPAQPKAPEGTISMFIPKDDCLFCQDAGLTMQDVFALARKMVELGEPKGLSAFDVLATVEATFA